MKLLRSLFLLLVTPGLVWAQSSTQVADASQNNPDVAAELKALREALLANPETDGLTAARD